MEEPGSQLLGNHDLCAHRVGGMFPAKDYLPISEEGTICDRILAIDDGLEKRVGPLRFHQVVQCEG